MKINGLRYTVKDLLKNTHVITISIENINNGLDYIAAHGIAEEIVNTEVY